MWRMPARVTPLRGLVRELGAVWISNEAPGVWPAIRDRVSQRGPSGAFLLAVDGRPVAWTDAHGEWIEWIEKEAQCSWPDR